VKYFFADSQDLVDPHFDFVAETRSDRIRQRDEFYAHEALASPAYDGLLVSKGIVDGTTQGSGRFTLAQRQRLLRVGAAEFYRARRPDGRVLPIMGDCGAFTYLREDVPPYSVDEVIDFYVECRFDLGISVDHVILAYQPSWDTTPEAVPDEIRFRQSITLELAGKFWARHQAERLPFEPLGVAQGWSPRSYADAVRQLQEIGYRYIALGGMVPLKTPEILASLEAISQVRHATTALHLLGVTRVNQVAVFAGYGVTSFDSTSPLRQAFKDADDNYWTLDGAYTAIRVPQVEGNPRLQRRIKAGEVVQARARYLEQRCLAVLQAFDHGGAPIEEVLTALREYELTHDPDNDHTEAYREVLEAKPWRQCRCGICQQLGHQIILFRGAERNRRRGFHNLWVFYRRLRRELGLEVDEGAVPRGCRRAPQLNLFQ
jgi:hypothetical protein